MTTIGSLPTVQLGALSECLERRDREGALPRLGGRGGGLIIPSPLLEVDEVAILEQRQQDDGA